MIYDEQEALIGKMENGDGERFNRSIRSETQKSCRQDRQSRLPLRRLRLRLLRLSVFGDHDLLSTAKIGSVLYARKDAKATNSSSLGAKAGGRKRTSITRCFEAGYQRSIKADAQGGSKSVEAVSAADRRVAWMDRMCQAQLPAISWLC